MDTDPDHARQSPRPLPRSGLTGELSRGSHFWKGQPHNHSSPEPDHRLTSHCRHFATGFLQVVLDIPLALEDGRVDSVQLQIVSRSSEVEQAKAVNVALVRWRDVDLGSGIPCIA